MRVIWKYELPIAGTARLTMPAKSGILSVQVQQGRPHLWALVDPEATMTEKVFHVVGTGNPIPDYPGRFVDTFQLVDQGLVFHVFEAR